MVNKLREDSQRYVNCRYIAESHRLSSCQVIVTIINVQRAFGYLSSESINHYD